MWTRITQQFDASSVGGDNHEKKKKKKKKEYEENVFKKMYI